MKEIFDSANFIWIIPLGIFGLLVFILTCYCLRKEIKNFVKKVLFPTPKRYSIPAGIISNVDGSPLSNKQTTEVMMEAVKNVPSILPPSETPMAQEQPKEEKPMQVTTLEAAKNRTRTFFNIFCLRCRIGFRKVKNYFKEDEDDETNLEVKPQQSADFEQKPTPPVVIEAVEQELVEETPLTVQEQPEQIAQATVEQETLPKTDKGNESKTAKKVFVEDRIVFTLALLILTGFLVFLSARVKLLTSMTQRQRVEISSLQRQINTLIPPQSRKVIVYDLVGERK